jgi:hypothetical protein
MHTSSKPHGQQCYSLAGRNALILLIARAEI